MGARPAVLRRFDRATLTTGQSAEPDRNGVSSSTVRRVPEPPRFDQTHETVTVPVPLRGTELERLDHAADRRGITREEMIAEAVDAFLAREMWSGGFVTPPPMEVPSKFPWGPGAFRLRRRP